jgi:hypothetical protein
MHVLLLLVELLKVISVFVNNEKCDNLVTWDLYTNSDWWLHSEELNILGIKVLEFSQISDKETNLDDILG